MSSDASNNPLKPVKVYPRYNFLNSKAQFVKSKFGKHYVYITFNSQGYLYTASPESWVGRQSFGPYETREEAHAAALIFGEEKESEVVVPPNFISAIHGSFSTNESVPSDTTRPVTTELTQSSEGADKNDEVPRALSLLTAAAMSSTRGSATKRKAETVIGILTPASEDQLRKKKRQSSKTTEGGATKNGEGKTKSKSLTAKEISILLTKKNVASSDASTDSAIAVTGNLINPPMLAGNKPGGSSASSSSTTASGPSLSSSSAVNASASLAIAAMARATAASAALVASANKSSPATKRSISAVRSSLTKPASTSTTTTSLLNKSSQPQPQLQPASSTSMAAIAGRLATAIMQKSQPTPPARKGVLGSVAASAMGKAAGTNLGTIGGTGATATATAAVSRTSTQALVAAAAAALGAKATSASTRGAKSAATLSALKKGLLSGSSGGEGGKVPVIRLSAAPSSTSTSSSTSGAGLVTAPGASVGAGTGVGATNAATATAIRAIEMAGGARSLRGRTAAASAISSACAAVNSSDATATSSAAADTSSAAVTVTGTTDATATSTATTTANATAVSSRTPAVVVTKSGRVSNTVLGLGATGAAAGVTPFQPASKDLALQMLKNTPLSAGKQQQLAVNKSLASILEIDLLERVNKAVKLVEHRKSQVPHGKSLFSSNPKKALKVRLIGDERLNGREEELSAKQAKCEVHRFARSLPVEELENNFVALFKAFQAAEEVIQAQNDLIDGVKRKIRIASAGGGGVGALVGLGNATGNGVGVGGACAASGGSSSSSSVVGVGLNGSKTKPV